MNEPGERWLPKETPRDCSHVDLARATPKAFGAKFAINILDCLLVVPCCPRRFRG